ncbi:MAG: hypothetical protein H6502_05025 [Candidatus Woesearchaeota archaeon]|nr:MAG: hypothetical protein H6502_05025 [Candidatus Woesearchaeota archaeon]
MFKKLNMLKIPNFRVRSDRMIGNASGGATIFIILRESCALPNEILAGVIVYFVQTKKQMSLKNSLSTQFVSCQPVVTIGPPM